MKRRSERWVVVPIALLGLASLALAQAQQPALRILSPEDGAVVPGSNVELRMEIRGVELTPRRSSNAAYLQLRLDDSPPVKGYSDRFTFQDVPPGNHVVRVEVRRSDGSELRPPLRSQVRFTVPGR